MNEIITDRSPLSETLYHELLENEPKPIAMSVPENAADAKRSFLEGERIQPGHVYSKMEKYPCDAPARIRELGERFEQATDLRKPTVETYKAFAENYAKKGELMLMMNDFRSSEGEEKQKAASEFMKRNIELHGEPDRSTYLSLVGDILDKARHYRPDSQASVLAAEVVDTLELDTSETVAAERFKPAPQTIEWMNAVANELYGGMLSHLPDQPTLSVTELQQAWSNILHEEFGGAADGWQVVVESAKSINVRASEKKIIIPVDRGDITLETARGLTVHEVGVHVYRSITGESTDVGPLANGLVDYYDAEEGLGAVMEQALTGKYREAGVGHYITAGMAYFHNLNFRQAFEMRWRLNAISAADESGEISETAKDKARSTAYGQTMRIMRGTDELPWFKDLAYYNGVNEIWQYLQKHREDEFMLSLLLQGKRNTSREHQNIVLESHTVR